MTMIFKYEDKKIIINPEHLIPLNQTRSRFIYFNYRR